MYRVYLDTKPTEMDMTTKIRTMLYNLRIVHY